MTANCCCGREVAVMSMSSLLWGVGHTFLNPPGMPFIIENHLYVSFSVMQIDTSALFYQARFWKRGGGVPASALCEDFIISLF